LSADILPERDLIAAVSEMFDDVTVLIMRHRFEGRSRNAERREVGRATQMATAEIPRTIETYGKSDWHGRLFGFSSVLIMRGQKLLEIGGRRSIGEEDPGGRA